MAPFEWEPDGYLALVSADVPQYLRLEAEAVDATRAIAARSILELGTGTGETARRLLAAHPDARLHGIDDSAAMLGAAREALAGHDVLLEVGRIEDPLPAGPFELVVSALTVHHLDAPGKADLFARVATVLAAGGRFVLADLIVPEDPEEAVTPIYDDYDKPSSIAEQLDWLEAVGLHARVRWRHRDLAVVVADRPRAHAAPERQRPRHAARPVSQQPPTDQIRTGAPGTGPLQVLQLGPRALHWAVPGEVAERLKALAC